jgi:hypothetical protein
VLHRGIAHMTEVKTPAGELSDPQQAVISAVLAGGGRVGVVRSADEMLSPSRCMGHSAGATVGVRGQSCGHNGAESMLPPGDRRNVGGRLSSSAQTVSALHGVSHRGADHWQ